MSDVIELLDSPLVQPMEVEEISPASRRRRRKQQVPEVIDLIDESSDEEPQGKTVRFAVSHRAAPPFAQPHSSPSSSARRAPAPPTASTPAVANDSSSRREKRIRANSVRFAESWTDHAAALARLKDPPEELAGNAATAAPEEKRSSDSSVTNVTTGFASAASEATAAAATAATYTTNSDDDDDILEVIEVGAPPEQAVLDVFPDVARNHVQYLLQQFAGNHDRVVSHLIDNPNYPKSKTAKQPPTRRPLGEAVVLVHRETTKRSWTYDFTLASSFEPTREYLDEAATCLYNEFSFLSKAGAKLLLKTFSHYALAHERVTAILRGTGDDIQQLNHYQTAMASQTLRRDLLPALHKLVPPCSVSLVMKTKKPTGVDYFSLLTDPILREEVEYVRQKSQSWVDNAVKKLERERKKDRVQQLGTGMECACCYDEYDIDDMVSCRRQGHLFCVDCLQQFASTKLFGEGNLGIDKKTKEPSLDLLCFHPEGCDSPFERSILAKALTTDTLLKYDELQANLAISKAGLCNLVTCPKCNFQADVHPSQKIFECPCDDCRFVSCRECGEAAHAPLRCEEVTKDAIETKGRLTVEEAITAAKIRKCPKCNNPFIKSDGCNKIRCGCGALSCYLCSQVITGYDHFCQAPHCTHESCNKCRLYSDTEKNDEVAMRTAGISAANEVQAKIAEIASKHVNIDVESILKKPPAQAVPKSTQPGGARNL